MIKIAVFSDVHGNLPALKTVLNDIKNRGIHQKFCLGDLIDFAPWPNEVIDLIRSQNIACLLGNHDERIAFDIPLIPLEKHSAQETKARFLAIDHSRKTISATNKAFLAELPFHLKLNYKVGTKHWKIQLVHATLQSNDTYVFENEKEEIFSEMLHESGADLLVMGHTHVSFVKQSNNNWAINCGSVGRSKEENRLASYLVLNLFEDKVVPEIVQLPYPLEEVAKAIENSDIPNFYADFLRNKR